MAALMAAMEGKRKLRWPAKPSGPVIHLAHLSKVDCQFVSRLKSFQNNNLQFDSCLFSSHLAHFVHAHRRRKLWKNVRTGLTKALGSLAGWRLEDAPIHCLC